MPFETTAPETNPSALGIFTQNLRFPGQYADNESSLFYNWNRYFDPATGRYITSDPIGLAGGSFSTYDYVNGQPTRFVDPRGLAAITIPLPDLPLPDWIRIPGARILGGLGLILSLSGDTPKADACPADQPCPPCKTISGKIVPVGTIGYRPLDNPSKPQHGIIGPHYNVLRANQAPRASSKPCFCFWQPAGAVPPSGLPAGAIPIEPFAN